jgi:ligand-binding sensor domain-containing protein
MRIFLTLLLFLGLPGAVQTQPFTFLQYSLSEGLPQSQVFAIFQDQRGFMWMGTQGGGLSRFDGRQFVPLQTDEGLPSDFVNALTQDAGGQLYAGTSKGLARIREKRAEAVPGFTETVYQLLADASLGVLAGTAKGVFRILPGQSACAPCPAFQDIQPIPVPFLVAGKKGIWAGTSRGLWLWDKNAERSTPFLPLAGQTIEALGMGTDGQLWVAIPGVLLLIDEKSMAITARYAHPAIAQPECLALAADGAVWVGTANNGLAVFDPRHQHWSFFNETAGLPRNFVRTLLCDRSGTLWAGTSGGGALRFVAQNFQHYSREQGLGGDRIYAVMEAPEGGMLVSASQNGLFRLDSSGIWPVLADSGFLRIKCKSLASDRFGRVWAGTDGKGIAVLDTPAMQVIDRKSGLAGDFVARLLPDPSGDMWVALVQGGLYRVRMPDRLHFQIQRINLPAAFNNTNIQTIFLDKNADLWVASGSGTICRVRNERVEWVSDASSGLPETAIRCLSADARDRLYAGVKGEGLYYADIRDKSLKFRPLLLPRPISRNIYLLQFDQAGRLWVGTENGVDKLVFDAAGQVTELEHFGKNEGFLGIESCQDASCMDRQGQLWFGTMNGLVKYLPNDQKRQIQAPSLFFTGISLFYKPIGATPYARFLTAEGSLAPGFELPWNQNHLSFAFQGIDLADPDHLQYRWRLEGAEQEWSPWSDQLQVNYASLAPGRYTFWAQALSGAGVSSPMISASFTIAQPFWQRWPFQAGAVLVLLGLITLLAWWWVRRVKKVEQQRREQLEVQNKLLQLEQKALQLQMNPHFIFNALNSIQSVVASQDFLTARQEISAFARLMRSVLNNSRQPFISLQEEADTLEQYLRIEQFCQQNKFEFDIFMDAALDPEEMEIPPMLLQPFVENAVIHGVSHLQYPGKIDIRFEQEGALLRCTLKDNGVGREKSALLRQARRPGHQSTALHVTRERLEALRGAADYHSLEITDITGANGHIAGTCVVVRLPLHTKY